MDQPQRPNRHLRLQRRLRGWSQEDVATGLHRLAASLGEAELGVHATMVSRWERGTRKPRPRYVRLLCHLLELPAEKLGIAMAPDALRDAYVLVKLHRRLARSPQTWVTRTEVRVLDCLARFLPAGERSRFVAEQRGSAAISALATTGGSGSITWPAWRSGRHGWRG